uniref:Type I-A CRISPR-associated protein Csa5 n=1 Tax=candidate division WOR-3 bacterium TaxID=2052148 RepID=A0A7C3IX16_UNCW3
MKTTLYTPATGYPDLEVKIAYGLARVGIEAVGAKQVKIIPAGGYYRLEIDADPERLNSVFRILSRRLLASNYIPFSTPGITSRSAGNLIVRPDESHDLAIYLQPQFAYRHLKAKVCGHGSDRNQTVGNVIGLSAATSFPKRRDGLDVLLQPANSKQQGSPRIPRRPTNPGKICKTCALLALTGTWFATCFFAASESEIMVIPVPRTEVSGLQLERLFSYQHQLRRVYIHQQVPLRVIPLLFFSRVPSSADFLEGFELYIVVLSRQQGYHVDGVLALPVVDYFKFIRWSPYNLAAVELLLNRDTGSAALAELNRLICTGKPADPARFARLYTGATSTDRYTNLLYFQTAEYLLKEVAMINPEIIKNRALGSLARTLRYFIWQKKYGYSDAIRNARKDTRVFEETIARMLREAKLRLEQEERIHLPNEEEVKEVFELADKDFEAVRLALVILAFSFPAGGEDN